MSPRFDEMQQGFLEEREKLYDAALRRKRYAPSHAAAASAYAKKRGNLAEECLCNTVLSWL